MGALQWLHKYVSVCQIIRWCGVQFKKLITELVYFHQPGSITNTLLVLECGSWLSLCPNMFSKCLFFYNFCKCKG